MEFLWGLAQGGIVLFDKVPTNFISWEIILGVIGLGFGLRLWVWVGAGGRVVLCAAAIGRHCVNVVLEERGRPVYVYLVRELKVEVGAADVEIMRESQDDTGEGRYSVVGGTNVKLTKSMCVESKKGTFRLTEASRRRCKKKWQRFSDKGY